MTNYLNAINIKRGNPKKVSPFSGLDKGANTYTLTVKGINNVFNYLGVLLCSGAAAPKKYSHYGKSESFNLLSWI